MDRRRFYERINLFVYDNRESALRFINRLSWLFWIAGVAIVTYFQGFSHQIYGYTILLWAFWRVLDFFILRFILRMFLSLSLKQFIRDSRTEKWIVLLLLFDHLFYWITGINFFTGVLPFIDIGIYFGFLQLLFGFLLFAEIGTLVFESSKFKLNPALLLALSFIFLIVAGALFLHLPEMTVTGRISWIDAFFTSTSASCVTGLSVLNTGSDFTFKGQMVILVLIFIGGLNMLTIATFIGSLYHKTGSLHAAGVIKGFLDSDQSANLHAILRNVILYAVAIQVFGVILVFFSWGNGYPFNNASDRLYHSVFHAISAFNNAGFSLFTDGFYDDSLRYNYTLHLSVALLIIVGGIGFLVLQDVFAFNNRMERKTQSWKKLLVNTRLVLYVTLILLIGGTVMFMLFEYRNTLNEHSFSGKLVTAFFQSVTTRTAGFNTVDFSSISGPTLLVCLLLMFVGASPGSTGGGIKTTTIAVAFKAAWANLRGREHVEFFQRNIPWTYVNKTYAVLISAFSLLLLFTLLMAGIERDFPLRDIVFEVVSAFGTVGLSMGITPDLSDGGKLILIFAMYVGRIGSLTLGLALTRKILYTKYRYPDTRLMIG